MKINILKRVGTDIAVLIEFLVYYMADIYIRKD